MPKAPTKFAAFFFDQARVDVANTDIPADHGPYLVRLVEGFEAKFREAGYSDAQLNPFIQGSRLVLIADEARDKVDDTFMVEYEIRGRGRAVYSRKGRVLAL